MSSNAERVEIYSGIQRRRRYSVDEKLRIVQEASQPGITISYVARRHGISPSLLFHWRRRMAEGGKEAVRVDEDVSSGLPRLKPSRGVSVILSASWARRRWRTRFSEKRLRWRTKKNFSRACRHCPTRVRCEDRCRHARRLSLSFTRVFAKGVTREGDIRSWRMQRSWRPSER
jgi:hypothetical protein